MSRRFTFVTICFEGDAGLMRLQARSMALYCDPSLVHEVVVIDNFAGGAGAGWATQLLDLYGPLSRSVRIVPAPEVSDLAGVSGWIGQQALKLAIAATVKSDRYVVLDAKNHLARPLLREFLETDGPDHRPRINGYPYRPDHPLAEHLARTCAYAGLDADQARHFFVRCSTPFTMITWVALAIAREVEAREGKPLARALADLGLTEFFLYGARLRADWRSPAIYDWGQPFTADLWPWGGSQDDVVAAAVARAMDEAHGPFFALHRGAIAHLTETGRATIATLWAERALFPTLADGIAFLAAD